MIPILTSCRPMCYSALNVSQVSGLSTAAGGRPRHTELVLGELSVTQNPRAARPSGGTALGFLSWHSVLVDLDQPTCSV